MTRARNTLRTDPELGSLFDDLDAVLDDAPLEPLRPPTGARPPSALRWIAAFAGSSCAGLAVVGAVAWLAAPPAVPPTASSPSPARNAAIAVPAEVTPDPEPPDGAPVPTDAVAPPIHAVARPVEAAARARSEPKSVPAPLSVVVAADPAPSSDAIEAPPPPPVATGSLAEEERLYRPAETALSTGDWDEAIAASDAYLARFPVGRWADKARLLQLDALVAARRLPEVVALALALDERPEFATRHGALLRVRAEALAGLGRCDEALVIVGTLPRADGAAVRRTCG